MSMSLPMLCINLGGSVCRDIHVKFDWTMPGQAIDSSDAAVFSDTRFSPNV